MTSAETSTTIGVGVPDLTLAAQYITALTGHSESTITWQTFDDIDARKKANSALFKAGSIPVEDPFAHVFHATLAGASSVLAALNAQSAGVFATVNATDLSGRTNRKIVELRACFIDKDDGVLDEAKISPICPPSFRIRTMQGEHAYWLLQRGEHREDFKDVQKRLIAFFGGDPQVTDLARVLRVPGFFHCKDVPTMVRETWYGDLSRAYTLDEILAAYPAVRLVGAGPGRPRKTPAPAPAPEPAQRIDPPIDQRIARARSYLAKLPASIQGSNGSIALFKAILAVYRGFALPLEDARALIESDYNVEPRSVPPWSAAELDHKFDDVGKIEDVAWGYILDSRGDPAITAWIASRATKAGATPATEGTPERPTIVIDHEEHRVNDEACAALARVPNVYQRGGALVRIVRDDGTTRKLNLARPPGTPVISRIAPATLQELFSAAATWITYTNAKGEWQATPAHPPTFTVAAVYSRERWEGIRTLEAVVESPVLRADGTVLATPGYDEATGLYYEPTIAFPAVPDEPTDEEVDAAIALLLDVVVDFPFATDEHRAAWFAGLLTCFARFAFSGPAPLFSIDANVRGCGKSLLAEIVGIIAAGRPMTKFVQGKDEDEDRKRITGLALAGDRFACIDNITHSLGNGAMDLALTSTEWSDRRLGKNENVREPLFVVWWATGNNISYAGDIIRRTAHIRLESPLEKPEERDGFEHGNADRLRSYVIANRGKLVAAALTVLRGYFVAGAEDMRLTPWGSFDAWSALVRNCTYWALEADPGDTRVALTESSDTEAGAIAMLVDGWEELCATKAGTDIGSGVRGCTAAQAVKAVESYRRLATMFGAAAGQMPEFIACPKLAAALDELLPGLKLNAVALGHRLRKMRGRAVGRRYLAAKPWGHGFTVWAVRTTA